MTVVTDRRLYKPVQQSVYMTQVAVQLRVPKRLISRVDRWVSEGRYANRSDAIRAILINHEERERTHAFAQLLLKRSEEASAHPERLVRL